MPIPQKAVKKSTQRNGKYLNQKKLQINQPIEAANMLAPNSRKYVSSKKWQIVQPKETAKMLIKKKAANMSI